MRFLPRIPFLLVASWWPFSSQDANASTEAASLLKPMVGCSSFKTVLWTPENVSFKKKNPARGPRPFPAYKPGEKAGGAGAGTGRRPDRRAPRGRSPGLAQGWSAPAAGAADRVPALCARAWVGSPSAGLGARPEKSAGLSLAHPG